MVNEILVLGKEIPYSVTAVSCHTVLQIGASNEAPHFFSHISNIHNMNFISFTKLMPLTVLVMMKMLTQTGSQPWR